MKRLTMLVALLIALSLSPSPVTCHPTPVFADPTATSFTFTASTVGASLIQLQGADVDATPLVYAIVASPSHGTISGLSTSLGYLVFTPTTGYTGSDSFTYKVTSGGADSNTATVTLSITNAKTRVVDTLLNPDSTPRTGKVSFILTRKVTSPAGIIPASSSVDAVLNGSGQFDVSVYPSQSLNPTSYYQVWHESTSGLRTNIGVYDIPPSTASSILLTPYAITSTQLSSQYTFLAAATMNSLATGLAGTVTSFNGRVGPITPATNDYTWAQINKATSSIADITTRSAADLSSGQLPMARLGSLTDTALPYKTSSALADSPLLRFGSGTVGFGAGTPAAPSTGSSLTGTRLMLLDGSSGEHLGIGVESGAFWFNAGSANSYKWYFGASSATRHSLSTTALNFANTTGVFTQDFQSSSGSPELGALIFNTNMNVIRFQMGDNPTANRFEMIDNTDVGVLSIFRPFTDTGGWVGDSTHRFQYGYIDGLVMAGSTSGSATLQAQSAAGSSPIIRLPNVTTTLVGKDSTDTLTNKTLDVEGTGNSVTIPIKVFLAAAGCNNATAGSFWDLPTSTAAVPACVTGSQVQKGVLDFADSGPFRAQNTLILPADFAGAIDARIIWTTTATTGNVKWYLATTCTAVGATETDDPGFDTPSSATTAVPGTANRVQTSAITGVTASTCSAGELFHLSIQRDGTDGSDTAGATVRLIGIEVTIRRAM